jgi:SOS response regulatory protein OraA/RecX
LIVLSASFPGTLAFFFTFFCIFQKRFKRKGCGLYRIRHELAQRGLSGEKLRDLLEKCLAPSEERELARRTLQQKLKTLGREPEHRKRMLRLQRFLRGRGFSDAVIVDVFEDLGW